MRQLNMGSVTRDLEALLLEGLQSGEPIPVSDDFWQGLHNETQRLVEVRTERGTSAEP